MYFNTNISSKNEFDKEKEENTNINNLYIEEENFNCIEENKKKIIFFYSKFKYLCCKYKIDNIRKNHIDVIIKKVKIKLFKGIHETIKYCLNVNINRLPQNFIINIKIEYNQQYLEKTLADIYSEFDILPSLREVDEKKMVKKDKNDVFFLFMNSKLVEVIKIYLMSNLFIYDKKKLEKKSGINDVILFNFVANNICDYFLYGNTTSNKKENISEINFNNIKNSVIENEEKQIDDFDDNN
jgi:hypothetical protein